MGYYRARGLRESFSEIKSPLSPLPASCGWKRHLDKHLNSATLTVLELSFSISEDLTSSEYKWVMEDTFLKKKI